jgi:hypothetical protein
MSASRPMGREASTLAKSTGFHLHHSLQVEIFPDRGVHLIYGQGTDGGAC